MTGSPYKQLFAELKRRRVFRVMAVYGIVGFVLLQIVDLVVPALLLPDWTYRLVALILLLGFPVAVVLAWAFEMTPEGVQRTADAAPGELTEIITAPGAHHSLSVLLALIGVTALVGGAWWIGRRTAPESSYAPAQVETESGIRLAFANLADDPRPSIAVLPFADMSPEGDQEYFSDGITEEILNVLAKISDLRVTARTSTFALKDKELTASQWGDTLNVGYLVEGSVRKAGEQLRITAQLIDTSDGSHLWSENYDRPLDNVFAIQSEIAMAIAEELAIPLGLSDPFGSLPPITDFEAYDLYLAGLANLRERFGNTFEAISLFKAALARDSTWAPAWAGLAAATEIGVWFADVDYDSTSFYKTLEQAEQAAQRALQLNPQNPTALVTLGSIHRDRYEWDEAETAFRRALDLDPDNAEAHQQYAEWLHKRGRVAEAVAFIDRAVALDPAPIRIMQLVHILRTNDQWDDLEDVLEWAVERGLDSIQVLANMVARLPNQRAFLEGRFDDNVLVDPPVTPADTAGRGQTLRALSLRRLDLVPDTMRDDLPVHRLVRLNEPELAVAKFLADRVGASPLLPEYIWYPGYDPIRSHPRFQAYMESIGLGGLTVHRTPVEERVRPAILRQADAAEDAEVSAP